MTPTVRTYYDADSTEGQPTYTPAGIGPSKVAERVDRVMAHAFKSKSLPFDDRSHLPVRRGVGPQPTGDCPMARSKRGWNSHQIRMRELPHVARLHSEEPFRTAD